MTENSNSSENRNHVYARDRASVVTCAIVAIVREAMNDPELHARIANTLRFEFADLERQVISENRISPET